ncbi:oligosaccharide flippase family protein [Sporomusa sp. KB1]|jgi:O-antigen/teichoic acid export membrane protein|uniref:oligosaccharide flippase family protein n=1 Tax=Sporomusa sp. KB1 TaxID=943346 RepID=UPI00119EB0EC|nr:oligosaccharide flippase family protein [Sporomusa sp. KB1]TWH47681.1 O-antigen/teichoic acid export membrane protein [Sporomusa sp. KB1]
MKQLPKKILENFGAGLMGRLSTQVISFILIIYLARVLGPESYGGISVVLAVISYFNLLATFGLPVVGIREAARKQNHCEESISQIFSVRICLAILSYFLLLAYGWFFITDTHLFYLLLLYGLTMLSSSWLLDWAFIGMEDLRSLAAANVMGSLCSCIFILLLVKNAADIFYIPVIMFTGSVLSCTFLYHLFHKVHSLHLSFTLLNYRTVLKLAMPFAITGGLSQVYENFDIVMLGFMVDHQEAGYYSVAYKIVSVLSGIIGIYSQSTFPVMIRLREKNPGLMGAFLKQNVYGMLFFMLPIITGGTILGNNIIETFFGEAYLRAATPFVLLLYYIFFMALSITLANWLLAVNEDKKYMGIVIVGAIINVTANLVLIPLWKSAGAAMAMIIAEVFVFCFLASKVKDLQQEDWVDKKKFFILAGSCIGMGICILTIQKLFQVHVGFLVFVGAALYIGLSWPFCAKFFRRTFTE